MKIESTSIFDELLEVSDPYDGILLDAYGVFWNGNQRGLIPGSLGAIKKLNELGKKVGILSNSTQPASCEIEKLNKHGLECDKHYKFLITSGEIARDLFLSDSLPFNTPNKKYSIFGQPHPKFSPPTALFEGSVYQETEDLSEADFIYLSIPHIDGEDQTDPEVFRSSVEEVLKSKLPMICANPDKFAHEGDPPRPVVRQGSIATLYEEMGGKIFYTGKPESSAFEYALKEFKSLGINEPHKILMVGDTPETDIRGANHLSIPSVLITETGVVSERLKSSNFNLFLQNLPVSDCPTHYIKRLGRS